MTTSFLGTRELRMRLLQVRRVLPLGVFTAVLVYQAFSALVLRQISESLHYLIDIAAYGIIGPVAAWFTITWLIREVQERETAFAAKAVAESEQQRALEAAREQERMLAAVCSSSADAIISLDNDGIVRTWNRG